jgi:large subunit ribosomal protein L32
MRRLDFCNEPENITRSHSIMGALPKQKTSKARKGKRRSHLQLALPQLEPCEQCKAMKVAHHVCPECGTYRKRQILRVAESGATE